MARGRTFEGVDLENDKNMSIEFYEKTRVVTISGFHEGKPWARMIPLSMIKFMVPADKSE